MRDTRFSRWLMAMTATALLAAVATSFLGCGNTSTSSDDTTVGFIYIGPKDDYGYSQAHAQGAAAVKKLPGVQILEVEKVPEDNAVQQTMKNMIDNEGAKVIFASSFGYLKPHVLEVAKKYPNVYFMHCGGPPDWIKDSPNVYSYFGYIDECQYLSGIVAGKMTTTNKLGFIAAKPISQVRRNINAFAMGARSVNPKAEVHVIFTGDWSLPTKEADAVEVLLKKDCDVFTCHVDSPKVIVENVSKAGKYVCGYHASQAELAGDKYLTGAEWNWEKVYVDYVNKIKKGEKFDNYQRGGLKAGLVRTSPYGPKVTDDAKKEADAVKAKLMDGSFIIFKGPLKDQSGKIVIPEGTKIEQNDPVLEGMDYLVEGVVGEAK